METVWLQEFSKLFLNYLPHSWYIMPVEEPPIPEDSLYSFFDSAKVRFCCDVSTYARSPLASRPLRQLRSKFKSSNGKNMGQQNDQGRER
jgi:hypothetical protein